MFTKGENTTFKYWFAHWCAYQMTALNCKVWKFKYLFHDIEKPWLELILRNHEKVKKWHRAHSVHHISYKGKRKKDYEAMVIDWECSRFTKEFRPKGAKDVIEQKFYKGEMSEEEYWILRKIVSKLNLY